MYCKKCGNQIDEGVAFCKMCGAQVEKNSHKADTGAGGNLMQDNMKRLKIWIMAVSLLMALATLLPWMSTRYGGSHSISLMSPEEGMGDGIFFVFCAVMVIVFLLLKKNIPVLVFSIISFLLYCFELLQIIKLYSQLEGYASYISEGSGFYLMTLSVIALLVLSIIFFTKNRNAGKQNG